jgi:hypothetical protein
MAQHKWHKEIKAWADGAEIEWWNAVHERWEDEKEPMWCVVNKYRIKPQPKVNEFAHIPYWLCCGSVSPQQHHSFCSEAKAGYPERCRFGTAEEHQKRMEKPPQPKEPQYLYVYGDVQWDLYSYKLCRRKGDFGTYLGKIKLEVDDVGSA